MKKLVDTNILLDKPAVVEREGIVISVKVLKELDGLKKSPNKETAEKARRAAVYISRRLSELEFDLEEKVIPTDDFLLECAAKHSYGIITNDVYLKVRAAAQGIHTEGSGKEENYTGISYFKPESEDEFQVLNDLYLGVDCIIPSISRCLKENEYLIVQTEKEAIFKKQNSEIIPVKFTTIKNILINEIKPRNAEQICLFDTLNNADNKIVYVGGRWGAGKSYVINNYALAQLEREAIKKIVYIPNNAFVANTLDIGALPGGLLDKTLGQIGPLVDLMGIDQVQRYISEERLEVVPMAFIRGRSFTDSIIIVNEAQNLTSDHMKLLLARVGEGSRIFVDGDVAQMDSQLFKDKNGIACLMKLSDSEVYSKIFSAVKLVKTERSLAAGAADYLESLE